MLTTERTTTLPDSLLETFRARAAAADESGRYPHEDLADLRELNWLAAAAPVETGGLGLELEAFAYEQRRLARYAPATALSTTMHHYWVGTAAELHRFGHPFADRLLGWVADGEVLASGHGEVGNDVPIALSTATAERVSGGWRLRGRKLFGSLGPVWDRIGVHAMDPTGPSIVHAFVRRTDPGVSVVETWDAQGMRATESHDTVLDGVFVADEDVLVVVPAGPSDDPAMGAAQAWALTLIANCYLGIAERAFELAVASAQTKTSIGLPNGTMAHHPHIQLQVASMHLDLDAARCTLDRLTSDWVTGVDHGPAWGVHVLSAKWRAATTAMRVVDLACDVVGGSSYRRGSELERLSRDVRAARFHPGTDAFTHEAIGKALLGVDAAERWG